jgi:hypothetical protein
LNAKSLASIVSSLALADADADGDSSLGDALALSLADSLGSALSEPLGLDVAPGWPDRGMSRKRAMMTMAAITTIAMIVVDGERDWTVMTYLPSAPCSQSGACSGLTAG